MRRYFKLVIACGLALQTASEVFAAVSTEDLRAMRAELKIDPDRWIQNEEEQVPAWWWHRIDKKTRELEKGGRYQEALDDLLRVDKLRPNHYVNLHLALCYAHLQRKKEALALMDKLPDYSWTAKAEIYSTLGLHEEALEACDDPTEMTEEPALAKASLLLAHNEREAAISALTEQYWHMARTNSRPDRIKALLNQLGVEPTQAPQVRTFNKPIIEFLRKLPTLPPPTTTGQLEKTFNRTFAYYPKDMSGQNAKCVNADTSRVAKKEFSYVRLIGQTINSPETLIVNPSIDSTFITIHDVRQILHNENIDSITEQRESGTTCDHCDGKIFGGGTKVTCASRDGQLVFSFTNDEQLYDIQKSWNGNSAEIKKNHTARTATTTTRASTAATPVQSHGRELDLVESKLSKARFKEAALELLRNWYSFDSSKSDRDSVQKLKLQKRDMLVRCYIGMNRPDIGKYLQSAPLIHIEDLAGSHNYLPLDKIFPTYDQYMQTKWHVSGNSSTPDGGYCILIYTRDICIYHDSPLFPKFYELIGPLVANRETNVPPLPGTLIDDYLNLRDR